MIRLFSAWVNLCAFACGAASAQTYPSKPVRVVISFAAGGATDVVGRIVLQKMGEQLKQQFVIENRAGAGGTIGPALVAKSQPDGYTMMVHSQTLLANAHLYERLPYDVLKDFIGIAPLTRSVGMLAVHPSMPVRTTRDFIALAKARRGEILYSSAGIGAFQHLSMSSLANTIGVNMDHVPFNGGNQAVVALMRGEVHVILTPIVDLYSHLNSGRVRAIAVSSDTRIRQFPDIPTIAETVKGFEFTAWFGAFVPAGTPRPIVERLNAELRKAVADRDVASKLSAMALDPLYMTPEDFAKHLKFDYDRLKEIVKLSGARIE